MYEPNSKDICTITGQVKEACTVSERLKKTVEGVVHTRCLLNRSSDAENNQYVRKPDTLVKDYPSRPQKSHAQLYTMKKKRAKFQKD